jgi:hypothetical protein
MESRERNPPNLHIFRAAGKIGGGAITADSVRIICDGDCLKSFVLDLIAVYYVFHLAYPRIYSQFLGVISWEKNIRIFLDYSPFRCYCWKDAPVWYGVYCFHDNMYMVITPHWYFFDYRTFCILLLFYMLLLIHIAYLFTFYIIDMKYHTQYYLIFNVNTTFQFQTWNT